MQLSKQTLSRIDPAKIELPSTRVFNLPERILQFGTGVLLRGLCDYYVNAANNAGTFNGRIVVVKSTASGGTDEFDAQENLYTICVRGFNAGKAVTENIVSAAISRVIPASGRWNEILQLASRPEMNIVVSNTTEVGLQLIRESIFQQPPSSFPAKLLSFLLERFKKLGASDESRIIIIPTELITENGNKLRAIVNELAAYNNLDEDFVQWLDRYVYFCNSLVDRIVTKDPGGEVIAQIEHELGYKDELLTMCEDYHLWAIQGNEYVKSQLSFAGEDEGAFVKPDIELFKSLKLHLLNGTHTLCAPLAHLSGFSIVREAMQNHRFRSFVEQLMLGDISPAIPFNIAPATKEQFGRKVIDRFSNPFLQHQWLNITLQQTTKMRMRNLPVLREYMKRGEEAPAFMATGFAAYLLFMRSTRVQDGVYYGESNGREYKINDEHAGFFAEAWQGANAANDLVERVLQNQLLWDDLGQYDSFKRLVVERLSEMMSKGVNAVTNFKATIVNE